MRLAGACAADENDQTTLGHRDLGQHRRQAEFAEVGDALRNGPQHQPHLALLDEVEQAARTVKGSERSWQRVGHEYTLWLDGEEVMIRANQLDFSGDEIEEGMSYYDEESLSLCGVEDFLQVVNAYRKFVGQS